MFLKLIINCDEGNNKVVTTVMHNRIIEVCYNVK